MIYKSIKKLKESFVGETVVLYLKEMTIPVINDSGDEMKITGMTDGYVVDIDEDFFYLGDESGQIEKAVSNRVIGFIEIAEVIKIDPDVLFEPPRDDEDVH